MLCYVHIGLFLERTNPVANPVVASQKSQDFCPANGRFEASVRGIDIHISIYRIYIYRMIYVCQWFEALVRGL